MNKCSVCDKKRAYMFHMGRSEFEQLCCLYCIKVADMRLSCATCAVSLGLTDGHDDKETEVFCVNCHKGKANMECTKCGVDVGYLAKQSGLVAIHIICDSCMGKVRKLKRK